MKTIHVPSLTRFVALSLSLLLAACAQGEHVASAVPPLGQSWDFARSDVPLDPAYRLGRLANGMRYVIRHNANPAGTVLVRMQVGAGSLDESEGERGLAHFVEHMAFQGSTHVPPGEMVHLLERQGLAFGADTNAATEFERTTYMLDLPRADPALVDTALMLMRETASELQFDATRVEHERGVILAEKRDRNSWQYRDLTDRLDFTDPAALYPRRMPIGLAPVIEHADSAALRAFWTRTYTPARTTLIVIGDIDPAAVEAAITAHFADWRARPSPPQPQPGPVLFADKGRAEIYLDPALAERVTISRHGPWQEEADTLAVRRVHLLREIGYAIVNRRLEHIGRRAAAPFRDAGYGTGDTFKVGRTTNLVVDEVDGGWRAGLTAAAQEWRRALAHGFTKAEVTEQLAGITARAEHAAAGADTRSNGALLSDVFALLRDDTVPTPPAAELAWLRAFAPSITPAAVLAAMTAEAVPLTDPLIRLQGRRPVVGGVAALRATWDAAMRGPLPMAGAANLAGFAYTYFGAPGRVVADSVEPLLGIREVRFANGVRLNLKRTALEKDRVLVALAVDGGGMLNTRANPLAVAMMSNFVQGGLGKHSEDELQTLLAGHVVGLGLSAGPQSFNATAATTPADLTLQLQVMAAEIADPGYRPEGEVQYRVTINNVFAALNASPQAALSAGIGGILSDDDPRFTLQKLAAFRALTFAGLHRDIADRLAHGAIEIGLVGDIDEAAAIAAVARTLGALPAREADFLPYADQRHRPFTADHAPRTLTHTGPADQALIRVTWATRDDSDAVAKQVLNMLGRVVQLDVTENLRQRLSKAYSPFAASAPTREWKDYGTFAITASVDIHDVAATQAAIAATVAQVRDAPPADDVMLRARAPLVESFDNDLKTNSGWLALVGRAQSESDRIDRQLKAKDRLLAVTPGAVQAAARQYLSDAGAVAVTVLPGAVSGVVRP